MAITLEQKIGLLASRNRLRVSSRHSQCRHTLVVTKDHFERTNRFEEAVKLHLAELQNSLANDVDCDVALLEANIAKTKRALDEIEIARSFTSVEDA